MGKRNAGAWSRHRFEPIVVVVEVNTGLIRPVPLPQQKARAERNVEVGSRGEVYSK